MRLNEKAKLLKTKLQIWEKAANVFNEAVREDTRAKVAYSGDLQDALYMASLSAAEKLETNFKSNFPQKRSLSIDSVTFKNRTENFPWEVVHVNVHRP